MMNFDHVARQYEQQLNRGLRFTGQSRQYFAQRRVARLASHLVKLNITSTACVLDFGCGCGNTTSLLLQHLSAERVVGADISHNSLAEARALHASHRVRYVAPSELGREQFDVAYCNGVFHHIAVGERPAVVRQILASLRPGGVFAFWENNPWNSGTRWIMRRVPFDRDARLVSPPAARRLLRDAGFRVLRTDSLFLFPWLPDRLGSLLEWPFLRLTLGGQYLVLCQKPPVADRQIGVGQTIGKPGPARGARESAAAMP
jgi:SAM-dependent methyltransferase